MSDDEMTITFEKDENIEGFVKALDLKDGNLYLVIKPEEDGFQIIGADKLPLGTGNEISTKMYILFYYTLNFPKNFLINFIYARENIG